MTNTSKRFVYLGSSGRIGQMLRRVWPDIVASNLIMDWQTRDAGCDNMDSLFWPRLDDPIPLIDHVSHAGGIDGLFAFCGVTPNNNSSASMSENVDLGRYAIEAAARAGVKRVILASSSAVYGAGSGLPFKEDDFVSPTNDYGAAKLEMEQTCIALAATHGIDLCCLRIGNVVGADSLLGDFAARAEPLTLDIFPDKDGPRRSYIGPEGLAQVLIDLAHHPVPLSAVLNVGNMKPVAMNALLEAADLPWTARHVAQSRFQEIALDCQLLSQFSAPQSRSPVDLILEWRNGMGDL